MQKEAKLKRPDTSQLLLLCKTLEQIVPDVHFIGQMLSTQTIQMSTVPKTSGNESCQPSEMSMMLHSSLLQLKTTSCIWVTAQSYNPIIWLITHWYIKCINIHINLWGAEEFPPPSSERVEGEQQCACLKDQYPGVAGSEIAGLGQTAQNVEL